MCFLSCPGDLGSSQRGRHSSAQAHHGTSRQNFLPEPLSLRWALRNHHVQRVPAANAAAHMQLHRPAHGRAMGLPQTQDTGLPHKDQPLKGRIRTEPQGRGGVAISEVRKQFQRLTNSEEKPITASALAMYI